MSDAPFVHNNWRYYGDWRATTVLCYVREGKLEDLLRANRGWMDALRKLSVRRWKHWRGVFEQEEAEARLLAVSQNQPTQPDDVYGATA